jgi:phosphoesterase RecJ-like protein
VSTPPWLADIEPAAFDAAVARVQQAVATGDRVVVAAHVSPDGDSLGGTLALHLGLARLGLTSIPTVGETPLKVPAALAELPGVGDLLPPAALPPASEVDLLITVDVASPDRLGRVAGYLAADVPCVVIDHHASVEVFGDVALIAPRAAAAVQVVDELLRRLDVSLDVDIATCLYVGLVTDTGRFGHANTDGSVMKLAGQLIDAGAPHAELTRRLFDTRSMGALQLLAVALGRLEFVADVALIHTHVTQQELEQEGLGLEALEAVIDVVRSADLAEVALVSKPAPDGTWRASLRSRGRADVGRIATRLGGGGHVMAAGFSASGPPQDIVARVIDLLREG